MRQIKTRASRESQATRSEGVLGGLTTRIGDAGLLSSNRAVQRRADPTGPTHLCCERFTSSLEQSSRRRANYLSEDPKRDAKSEDRNFTGGSSRFVTTANVGDFK